MYCNMINHGPVPSSSFPLPHLVLLPTHHYLNWSRRIGYHHYLVSLVSSLDGCIYSSMSTTTTTTTTKIMMLQCLPIHHHRKYYSVSHSSPFNIGGREYCTNRVLIERLYFGSCHSRHHSDSGPWIEPYREVSRVSPRHWVVHSLKLD